MLYIYVNVGLSHIYYDMTVREREMMILYEALEKQFCCFLPYAYSHLAAPFAYFIVACLHVCDCTYKRVGEGAGAFWKLPTPLVQPADYPRIQLLVCRTSLVLLTT